MDGLVLDKVESNSVNVVGSNFGLGIFPTRSRGWAAAHRVLKDDGLLVITAWDEKSANFGWFDGIAELYNAAGKDGDEPMPPPSLIAGTDKERVLKELQAAGFRDVKVYHTAHTIVFDDPKGMLQANMSNPATSKFLERLTKEQIESALTACMEKDTEANFYEAEASSGATSTDPFADGRPRLIPFAAFSILARNHFPICFKHLKHRDAMNEAFTNEKWSAHAQTYKAVAGALTTRWATDALQVAHHQILPLLAKHSTETFHFLDVGCGPGFLTFEFMRRYLNNQDQTNLRITATDLSDGMLDQLKQTLQEDSMLNQFASKVTTVQMDGLVLDKVESNSVNVVGSNFGLGIFPTRSRGWAAAHRVLKDDGLLVITAWDEKSANFGWFDGIAELYNAAGKDGDEPMPPPSLIAGTDKERVLKELQAAGFRDVKVYHTAHTIVFDDPKGMLQANMSNPATSKFLERLTKEQIESALTACMEKDTEANFYEAEASSGATSTDPFADGRPRLIPFAAFSILARK
ncbi:hypothetical protein BBO99_00004863 [Phytophthora kernoviae]|uniref:Methyltransferase type 11 domain-containing protein n=2 Tax=Phytophthora kernoviae TaxID=325452 RepID=A0A3R7NGD2_9STRA|nr:hypothetical protein G195_006815 [Phytophthora kernoviae 00238/432]KAG2522705.1 hypothetical protein JM18_006029 [Phytophthora kernoviae]RLN14265.1 hypothetical protein BBI17_004734 [Phytophthora kernoviae]RLN79972.1 hypothetical protein BBO99_00004863 [Phytophthora kernoviae]